MGIIMKIKALWKWSLSGWKKGLLILIAGGLLSFLVWNISELMEMAHSNKDEALVRIEIFKLIFNVLTGVAIGVGLYLTWRRITATEENVRIAQEGQVTERFTRAIEHLGNERLEIRLGGIYALERIAKDSKSDHWTVMETLTAFVRARSLLVRPNSNVSNLDLQAAIQAALTVIGRREWLSAEKASINLSKTDLRRYNLIEANLKGADLCEANLKGADLREANLEKADLREANLEGAKNVTQKMIDKAITDGFTVLPEGIARPESKQPNTDNPAE